MVFNLSYCILKEVADWSYGGKESKYCLQFEAIARVMGFDLFHVLLS